MKEHDVIVRAGKEECRSIKLAQTLASPDESVDVQRTNVQNRNIQLFNNNMDKQHMASELDERINRKNLGDLLARRSKHDLIIFTWRDFVK